MNLIIVTDIKSFSTAKYSRILNYSKSLASENVNVYIFSIFSDLRFIKQIQSNIYISDLINNESNLLNKIKSKLFLFRNVGFFFENLIRFAKGLSSQTSFLVYSYRFSIHINAINELKKKNNFPIFLEKCELSISFFFINPFYISLFKHNFLFLLMDDFYFPRKYDGIIVISKNLENIYSKHSNIIKIPILSDTAQSINSVRNRNNEVLQFGYFGSITMKNSGLPLFMECMAKLNGAEVILNIYGVFHSGLDRKKFLSLIEKLNLVDKVHYKGIVGNNEVINYMRQNDVLILPRPNNLQTKYGFATKLAEYLYSSRGVLVTDVSDNKYYIKDGFNGFIVKPGSINDMYTKIKYIIENKELLPVIGERGFQTAEENFSYKIYSQRLKNFFFH